ncbi:MAG: hypothetical protein M1817_006627 [Caeruleum heppii]|nr:MAG: hypothetical protein M1817_006627 [Caeruleum heppii]
MTTPADSNPTNGVHAPSPPELEVKRLHSLPSEQQDLYLLTFSADLLRYVDDLDADSTSAQQVLLKKELVQILKLSSPAPTRVIRRNIGQAFATIFRKGDRKLLYESINELLAIVNGGKGDSDLSSKHAAAYCLGEIFGAAGDSAVSISNLATTSLLKLLKGAQIHTGLRTAVFRAVGKLFGRVGSSADPSMSKDAWKQARAAASTEKAAAVQIGALWCMEQIVLNTPYFDNTSDFESAKNAIFKALDTALSRVRHAAASTFASILVKSHRDIDPSEATPQIKKLKKSARKSSMSPEDDGEVQRSESPGPKKSAVELRLTFSALLKQLGAHYIRFGTSNRCRAGLTACYIRVVKRLGLNIVRTHYIEIIDHLFVDILSHPNIIQHRHRLLTARRFTRIILEDVIGKSILDEAGQNEAAKILINDYLKNYPQVIKERSEPTKYALTGALSALASLLRSLGSAANNFAESCRDGLLQVLPHPSYTVQISTAYCKQALVLACPQQLLPCVSICMNSVTRELTLLTTPRYSNRRCLGYAHGLAAVISATPQRPLYGSVEINARVVDLATGILKNSVNSEIRISATQIQVAWILMGSLMSLGPSFVKIHLPQLLLLWRNALPKPMTKDELAQTRPLELSFLTHVRECALGSIRAFLEFNGRLLTSDVSKRIAVLLQNTNGFLNSLPPIKPSDDISIRLLPALQLQDLSLMTRRRVLQCYTTLITTTPPGSSDLSLHPHLLTLAMSFFADPDNFTPSSLSTSIADSAGTFDGIWDVGDNYGFGITGLVRGHAINVAAGSTETDSTSSWLVREGPDATIDQTLLSPICGAREHDPVSLYTNGAQDTVHLPDAPATEVVNSAIALFAVAFPSQPPKIQESILEQMATFYSAQSLQRSPGRKAALTVNIALALLTTLRAATGTSVSSSGSLRNSAVEKMLDELIRGFMMHPDPYVRNIGCEALGRLCRSSGNTFTANEIKTLVDTIVSNRDPSARAGCAVALGCIHSEVGGMAAGYHLKNICGILMSLASDPHPTVHFWALEGLNRVANSAGLTFSALVSSCLGMLAQLYVADTHNEEGASAAYTDLEVELPTTSAIARCLDALVNVLGPDLQDMAKTRGLILTLVHQLRTEQDPLVVLEGMNCLGHVSLFASGYMDFSAYVRTLQVHLGSADPELRDIAIDGLYNVMKRGSVEVLQTADAGLESQLWLVLDAAPNNEGVRNIIKNWLQETAISEPARWIERLQAVLNKMKARGDVMPAAAAAQSTGGPDLQDEEVAGFAATEPNAKQDAADGSQSNTEPLRWQVRTFAMECLSELLAIISTDMEASTDTTPAEVVLQQKVGDVIRMAFSASTSDVLELRVWGLRIVDQVLRTLGKTPDPDFVEASLLEQYQAQISSALTPAFTAESSPELAAEAINVCGAFIATGIVTDVHRMGRILKLLVSALHNLADDQGEASIGDLKGLSSNAYVMIKLAVLSAWAELQVASSEEKYLEDVVKPYVARLTPLWLSALKDFARLRFEPDISMSIGPVPASDDIDAVYAALNRETLLQFYQASWLKLVDAIASLTETNADFVFDALDEKPPGDAQSRTNGVSRNNDINYRDEPVAFFFILFGIVFEALVGRSGDKSLIANHETLETLLALKKILQPGVAGRAIYQDLVFSETMDLLNRLVLSEGLATQAVVVDIVRDLCISHPSAREGQSPSGEERLSEDIDQLFELTRTIVLVLQNLLPDVYGSQPHGRRSNSDEALTVINQSFGALVDAAEVFPSVIRTDLHACIFYMFCCLFGNAASQTTIVPQSLPIFRRFLLSVGGISGKADAGECNAVLQLRGCMECFLRILSASKSSEEDAGVAARKNVLLASSILCTSGAQMVRTDDVLAERLLQEMVNCLSSPQTAKVASNCIRSVLQNQSLSSTNPAIISTIIGQLVAGVAGASNSDLERDGAVVTRLLTSFAIGCPAERAPPVYSLVVSAILYRVSSLDRTEDAESAAMLVELASAHPAAFRGLVQGMSGEQKALLQTITAARGRVSGGAATMDEDEEVKEATSIQLKMDFMGGKT